MRQANTALAITITMAHTRVVTPVMITTATRAVPMVAVEHMAVVAVRTAAIAVQSATITRTTTHHSHPVEMAGAAAAMVTLAPGTELAPEPAITRVSCLNNI